MSILGSIVWRSRNVLLIVIVLSLNACGSEPEDAATQTPTVDPRFASADAILETYNQIITQPRVDPHAWHNLFYAENDLQRRVLACLGTIIPFHNLEQKVYEEFGELFTPNSKSPPYAPDKPSKMIEYNDHRAIAEGINTDGETYKTYFVQIGNRWWISGYTFEHDPDTKKTIENLDAFERIVATIAAAAPTVLNKIESGEITSAEQARTAFAAEIARQGP